MGEECGLLLRTGVNPKAVDQVEKQAVPHWAAQGREEAAYAPERHPGPSHTAFAK